MTVEPACLTEVRRTLDLTPGVTVHHLDPATGRCVAVLESGDRGEGERLFAALAQLPHVRSVDLVYHLVDHDDAHAAACPEFAVLEPSS
jgi:nitrate reductase NapAB chaperone NapD